MSAAQTAAPRPREGAAAWRHARHVVTGNPVTALAFGLFFLLLHLPPEGRATPQGMVAGMLLGAAVLGGLLPRLIGRRARLLAEWLLVAHVFTGLAGFLVFLAWASRL